MIFNPRIKIGIFHKLLMVMIIVALVPMSIIWYIDYHTTKKRLKQHVDERLKCINHTFVTHVNDWVEMNHRMLKTYAELPAIKSMQPTQQNPVLNLITDEYPWIYLAFTIGPDGYSIGHNGGIKVRSNYADRDYVTQILDGEPMGQQVVISEHTVYPSFVLSVPVRDEHGEIIGILAAGMSVDELSERVTSMRTGDTGFTFLLDKKGKVIAHQHQNHAAMRKDYGMHPAFKALTEAGEARIEYIDEDRDVRVIAFMAETNHGWVLITQQDYDEVFRDLDTANRNALILLVVTLTGVLVTSYLVSRRISKPVLTLAKVSHNASTGQFDSLKGKIVEARRTDEIGELARAIERLAISLRTALRRRAKTPPTQSQ
jgi:methyl-accepting chemotaxis protein